MIDVAERVQINEAGHKQAAAKVAIVIDASRPAGADEADASVGEDDLTIPEQDVVLPVEAQDPFAPEPRYRGCWHGAARSSRAGRPLAVTTLV